MDIRRKGMDFPTIVTVRYEVDSETYEIRESLKLKSQGVKTGGLLLGHRKRPVLPNAAVGNPAQVAYDPERPAEAYLCDNVGKMNC